MSIGIAE